MERGAGVARASLELDHPVHHGGEILRHARRQSRSHGSACQAASTSAPSGTPPFAAGAREQRVHHGAHRADVGAQRALLAAGLLGRREHRRCGGIAAAIVPHATAQPSSAVASSTSPARAGRRVRRGGHVQCAEVHDRVAVGSLAALG